MYQGAVSGPVAAQDVVVVVVVAADIVAHWRL